VRQLLVRLAVLNRSHQLQVLVWTPFRIAEGFDVAAIVTLGAGCLCQGEAVRRNGKALRVYACFCISLVTLCRCH
jgi:hypothetical protein